MFIFCWFTEDDFQGTSYQVDMMPVPDYGTALISQTTNGEGIDYRNLLFLMFHSTKLSLT